MLLVKLNTKVHDLIDDKKCIREILNEVNLENEKLKSTYDDYRVDKARM